MNNDINASYCTHKPFCIPMYLLTAINLWLSSQRYCYLLASP